MIIDIKFNYSNSRDVFIAYSYTDFVMSCNGNK